MLRNRIFNAGDGLQTLQILGADILLWIVTQHKRINAQLLDTFVRFRADAHKLVSHSLIVACVASSSNQVARKFVFRSSEVAAKLF